MSAVNVPSDDGLNETAIVRLSPDGIVAVILPMGFGPPPTSMEKFVGSEIVMLKTSMAVGPELDTFTKVVEE
jgi:hypothetical protein